MNPPRSTARCTGPTGSPGVASYTLPEPARWFADGFHVFAVEWTPGGVTFLVGRRATSPRLPGRGRALGWVFDHPFYMVVNLAVGGVWPDAPVPATAFPAEMLVDHVRVYQRAR